MLCNLNNLHSANSIPHTLQSTRIAASMQCLQGRCGVWQGCALQRRCLTDTLMEVPSEQDYELRRRGSSVRSEIFELVRQHLRKLTFPEADGTFLCHASLSLTEFQ